MSGLPSIEFKTLAFTPAWSRAASERVIDILLEAQVEIDCLYLRLNPRTPHPYESGVRYFHDATREEWLAIPACLRATIADCKSLAAWLAACYRTSGVDRAARCCKTFSLLEMPGGRELLLFHIRVQRGDGSIEDPSRVLGMNQEEPDGYLPVPGVAPQLVRVVTHLLGGTFMGDALASSQLEQLRSMAADGHKGAQYLKRIADTVWGRGYDPTRTVFRRSPTGVYFWDHPAGTEEAA